MVHNTGLLWYILPNVNYGYEHGFNCYVFTFKNGKTYVPTYIILVIYKIYINLLLLC